MADKKEEPEEDFRKLGTLDIRRPYQLSYWAEELGISRQALKNAWFDAGPEISKIKEFLKKKK
ncbi:MAG: DUF3606 domain-containing protein [Chitinophagales bacterium]|nr:DUF3606 domain-containing protein [Chitinophagales bacterium]